MNTRLIKVPFNIETAREITEGKIKGRVIDVVFNCPARILDFNFNSCVGKLNIVVSERERGEVFCACNDEGCMFLEKDGKFDERPLFMLEIPKSEEKFGNTLNPFDKVLVRDNNLDEWKADFSVIIRKMFFGMDAYLEVILNVFRIMNRQSIY